MLNMTAEMEDISIGLILLHLLDKENYFLSL